MALGIKLPPVPRPPETFVRRLDANGLPTTALVEYETKLRNWMEAVKAAIEGL